VLDEKVRPGIDQVFVADLTRGPLKAPQVRLDDVLLHGVGARPDPPAEDALELTAVFGRLQESVSLLGQPIHLAGVARRVLGQVVLDLVLPASGAVGAGDAVAIIHDVHCRLALDVWTWTSCFFG
jgi:hypothetical protein